MPGTSYGICHCTMCQRWAGSALFAITIPEVDITFSGIHAIQRFQSSGWAERAWCGTCGSSLWYKVTEKGQHFGGYEIPIGLFDDANGLVIAHEIFIDRKPDAFALAGDHERLSDAETLSRLGITEE
ncbi:GFA family protein [Puniceibacterium antarcticum]|nr:GFA family protein [Puniceibacterium antarcticum]